MSNPMTPLAAAVQGELATSHGGRIIAVLATSTDEKRQELAYALLASVSQDRNADARDYLASLIGAPASTATASAAAPPAEKRPEHIRPNGTIYYARKWGNNWDVNVLEKSRETGQPVLLVGEPGTGKTAMVEGAFGNELITTVITGETQVSGLVGQFTPDPDGGYFWVDGPLLKAVREGRPILMDEILLADPKVLAVVYPLLDGRGFIDVEDNPSIGHVQAKDGFYVIGAGNPNVPGAKMSEALVSRFPIQTKVTTDWDLVREMGVDPQFVQLAKVMGGRVGKTLSWAPQFREALAYQKMEVVWDREFALRNLTRLVPEADLDLFKSLAGQIYPSNLLIPSKV